MLFVHLVYRVELIELVGCVTVQKVVISIYYTLCLMRECQDPLEFPAHELKKFFKMGDHVKVIAGRYENDTGLIVRVEDSIVVLFSDLTMHEVDFSSLVSVYLIVIATTGTATLTTVSFSFYSSANFFQTESSYVSPDVS